MVLPGALVMLSPILCGVGFGTRCVTGLLAGGIASGVQMAISSSNTGGAWDNAKKYISKGAMDAIIGKEEPDTIINGKVATKKSQIFKSAVTGDTVGDPLKDTSGPALNILMKLMAIISVVFAPLFLAVNNGGGLIAYVVGANSFIATTNLAVVVGGTANSGASNVFVATVFLAGALAGMGGLFISQRIHAPPSSKVMNESIKKPLLVCRTDVIEASPVEAPIRAPYSPANA